MANFQLPPGAHRVRVVYSFKELAAAELSAECNCVVWIRELDLDYLALIDFLDRNKDALENPGTYKVSQNPAHKEIFESFPLRPEARKVRDQILQDVDMIQSCKRFIHINHEQARLPKDLSRVPAVEAPHADFFEEDHPPGSQNRWMCCYTPVTTLMTANEDAVHVGRIFYRLKPGARIFTFPPGSMWKHMVSDEAGHNREAFPPLIHWAPVIGENEPGRLIITADG